MVRENKPTGFPKVTDISFCPRFLNYKLHFQPSVQLILTEVNTLIILRVHFVHYKPTNQLEVTALTILRASVPT